MPYRLRVDPKDGQGAGARSGRVFVENCEITKTNDGIVSFTVGGLTVPRQAFGGDPHR